jgi:uncharacterized protein YaiL (DUF2058 family)
VIQGRLLCCVKGESLADQLLSAVLVDSKKLKQAQQEKRKEQKHQPKGQSTQAEEMKRRAEQFRAEKAEQDRLLNEKRLAAERNKEIRAQVRQLLQQHAVKPDGEIRFNFKDSATGKVRYLFVSENQQSLLAAGQLLICGDGKRAVITSRDTGERIRERSPEAVLFDANSKTDDSELDDAYKDFPIPDDLIW